MSKIDVDCDLIYMNGLNNHFETEAIANMLPRHRNNPLHCPGRLYTEQLSGTAFTSPRCSSKRTWMYRIQPSVVGSSNQYQRYEMCINFGHVDWYSEMFIDPNPMRWRPMPLLRADHNQRINFVHGVRTIAGCGDPLTKNGIAIYQYSINTDMRNNGDFDCHLMNSDGDFLIVPEHGSLDIQTELGRMIVGPQEFCVIPRGIVYSVNIDTHSEKNVNARGYCLEVFRSHFSLPELGPIGSNGLANPRDFMVPTASFDDPSTIGRKPCTIFNKFGNLLFHRLSPHSPYNVVAWHGNYYPFKYDLSHFCTMNSVSYDHPDPSIYTVLTTPSCENGTALADFVVFPPRFIATDENTFRPPWFHRNCMSEFMGLIYGRYDAKEDGFLPGGASLHNCMTPHGPDAATYHQAMKANCSFPIKLDNGLAFMFETSCILKVSKYALTCRERDLKYPKCWDSLNDSFTESMTK